MAAIDRLARDIGVDVSTDGVTWLNLAARVDNAPNFTPNKQDSTNVDTDGFTSADITLQSWAVAVKYNAISDSGVMNPSQELIRLCVGQFGDSARLYVRWYDRDGGSEAWSGRAIVELQRSKTGVADLQEMSVTFTGDGAATRITNPYSAALAPVVTAATPSAVAVGGQVRITGQHFTGTVATTGVKFGGTNATSWIVVSDTTIVAVMPAGSAGSAVVLVTNATGASNSFPYTRGA